MKKGFLIIVAVTLLAKSFGQIPYELNWTKESILLGASGLLMVNMALADPEKTTMTVEEIAALDPGDVNPFDRGATNNWSEGAVLASDVGLIAPSVAAVALPLYMPAVNRSDQYVKDVFTLGVIWL
jgi:hypothetical protein